MESGPLSYRTPPQDHAEDPRSPAWYYEKCKIEMMKKPKIKHMCYIMELDMLLLNLINLTTTDMLKTESNQNQLKQLVELIKMNVNLFIHDPDLLQPIRKLDLEKLGHLAASHTTDQASTQHDYPVKWIKEIYEELEKAKAKAGQFEFDQNSIEAIRTSILQAECQLKRIKVLYDQLENAGATTGQVELDDIKKLIQQYHEESFQAEHQPAPSGLNNDVAVAEHIVNLLPVELRPDSAKSNLNLVKRNIAEIQKVMDENLILLRERPYESNSNQMTLTNELTKIPTLDCRVSYLRDDSSWEEFMKSEAAVSKMIDHYIDEMDSFKDICNQVAAMYKYSYRKIIKKSDVTESSYTWCGSFHKDIFNGNCKGVEKFLEEHPLALTAKITVDGNTALHIAVKAKKPKIVRMLLLKLKEEKKLKETVKKQNKEKKTALYIAASGGFSTIAKELVEANDDTLLINCENETIPLLPLFVAAKYDSKEVVTYLYEQMEKYKTKKVRSGDHQKLEFFPKKNEIVQKAGIWEKQWTTFLADLIHNDEYDIAILVNSDYPSLARLRYTIAETPLLALAQRPSLGANMTLGDKASGNKVDRNSTSKASELLKKIISKIELQSQESLLSDALFKAVEVGSVVFVTTIINSLPPALSWLNKEHQNIFHVAIIHRQEEVFNLIYGLGPVKYDLAGTADKFNNWMLHLTGKLAPLHRLNQVPSAALQLQRELKWFKAVKAIVPNSSTKVENVSDNKSPYELFVSEHKELMEAGIKWIKGAASSCSIVATLITTVVFAAAFTMPAGNFLDTDHPILLMDKCFLIFVISDAVALFSSCTSVLIFMAILTSRFALQDFLSSLPTKLIIGIGFLFISMLAMMSAFGVTIYIIIRHRYGWCYFPIIVAGCVPVVVFISMIPTLVIDFWKARRNSIFEKPARHLYY